MRADHMLRLSLYSGLAVALGLGVPGAGAHGWWAAGAAVTVLALARFPDAWRGLWAAVPIFSGLLLLAGGFTYAPERAAAFRLLGYLLTVAVAASQGPAGAWLAGAAFFAVVTWGSAGWPLAGVPWQAAVAEGAWFLLLAGLVSGLAAGLRRHELVHRRLQRQATTDGLTGLFNHRTVTDRLDRALAEHVGTGRTLSILMVDLDQFKLYNDTFGHQAGDEVLRRIAAVLAEGLDPAWTVGRVGGDEFLVILPGLDTQQAGEVGQAIIDRLGREKFRPVRGKPMTIGASVGVATCPTHGTSRPALLGAADTALYAAKAGRGNRVQFT